ncbi:MAG TPA: hypothetical protein VLA75_02740, partial [Thermoanaerobaculia bacterium]|nr:hypothetical protein [Thermoanaerobaculia bacterium]
GASGETAPLGLDPLQSVQLPDVLLTLGIAEGSAALRLRASGPAAHGTPRLGAELRIEDRAGGSATGTTQVPAVPESDWFGSPRGLPLRGLGPEAPAALALTNPEAGQRAVQVRLRSATGATLGTAPLLLPGRSFSLRSLARLFPGASGETAPLGLELETDGALLAAVEEGAVGGRDRLFRIVGTRAAAGLLFLPIAGDHDPEQSRRLLIFNPEPSEVTATFALLEDGAGSSPRTASLTIPGGGSREIAEPRLALFGAGEGAGLLRVTWDGGVPAPYLGATVESLPLDPVGLGTAATPEPAPWIATEGFVPLPPPGSSWLSRLRLLEIGARTSSVRVELLDALGEPLGVRTVSLDPRGLTEHALAALFPGPADGLGWQLRLRVENGGPVIAWLLADHEDGDRAASMGRSLALP